MASSLQGRKKLGRHFFFDVLQKANQRSKTAMQKKKKNIHIPKLFFTSNALFPPRIKKPSAASSKPFSSILPGGPRRRMEMLKKAPFPFLLLPLVGKHGPPLSPLGGGGQGRPPTTRTQRYNRRYNTLSFPRKNKNILCSMTCGGN